MAASVLVTPSISLADATDRELAVQLETTVHRERVSAALSGRQSAIVLVDDIDAGVKTVNAYAAEHLEIQTADAREVAGRIRSAGAIFVGAFSPVSLGDYCAGSNHVLPTAGCARHSSGLSVQTFLRGIHVVDYDEAALKDVSGYVITLAEAENLPRTARRCAGGSRREPLAETRSPWTICRSARTCAANHLTAHRNSRCRCGSTPTRTRIHRPRR